MMYNEYLNYIDTFIINYFSVKQNRIFWILIFTVIVIEKITNICKRKRHTKKWLKKHNIGSKYKHTKNKLPETQYEKQQEYIESIWEEINK